MTDETLLNDRYQLLEKLGSGGMADVFRARDLMLDRIVAIKVLRKDYSSNPEFQNYFRMEARSAANLSHPNIVTVHDFGFADNLLFIVMEFIPGKDLKHLIRERGRFSVETGIPLIIQACAGLGYAHRAGLVHCDVKPHNLLVTPDQRLKVTDFGVCFWEGCLATSQRKATHESSIPHRQGPDRRAPLGHPGARRDHLHARPRHSGADRAARGPRAGKHQAAPSHPGSGPRRTGATAAGHEVPDV